MSYKDKASGVNPYQREFQITIPSSETVRSMGAEMIDMTKRRRSFLSRAFNKQSFYNCLIAGMYDIERHRDVDQAEIESRGLLAIIVDRGASVIGKMIASSDAPVRPRGAPVAIGADREKHEVEDTETPIAASPSRPRKRPQLVIPRNWSAFRRDAGGRSRDRGAEKEHEVPNGGPLP